MAVQAKPLTNTEVKAARAKDKDLSLYDGGGLLLLVKPSGIKTWRFRHYHPTSKKRTTITFGNYPALSLADARQIREETRALIDKGIDPQEHQRQEQERKQITKGSTFAKVAADGYEVKKSQNLAANTIKDIWRSLEKYTFPFVGNIAIADLTARSFITALEPLRASGKLETVKRVAHESMK